MRTWKFCEICEHGSLGRSCDLCFYKGEVAGLESALPAEREKVVAVTETWLAVAAERDAARAEVDRLNHEEAEWFTAHARGFKDADRGILLADCKEETQNAATAWACGWLERGWQKRCEEAESQRDALADRVRGLEGALETIAEGQTEYGDCAESQLNIVQRFACAALTPPAPKQENTDDRA